MTDPIRCHRCKSSRIKGESSGEVWCDDCGTNLNLVRCVVRTGIEFVCDDARGRIDVPPECVGVRWTARWLRSDDGSELTKAYNGGSKFPSFWVTCPNCNTPLSVAIVRVHGRIANTLSTDANCVECDAHVGRLLLTPEAPA